VKPAWSCSRDPDLQFQGITCQGAPSALVTVLVFKRLALHRNRTALHDPFAWPASSRNLSQNQLIRQVTAKMLEVYAREFAPLVGNAVTRLDL
jgi:hypothetical protein